MVNSTKKRPGGPLVGRPVLGIDGKWYDQFGCEIVFNPKDTKYSDLFWSKQLAGVREAIIEKNILSAAGTGLVGVFVSPNGITEDDKERLSAYREHMLWEYNDKIFPWIGKYSLCRLAKKVIRGK